MGELKGLSALIIEPNTRMRASLRNILNLCGLLKIDDAAGSGAAIRFVSAKQYDLILCEYDLDGGQDGQQFLEDLRHHKLINASTMFFMVTGEGNLEKVVSAVELAPTDYILKPFAADRMLVRLERALARRKLFVPVYQLMEMGREHDAIAACIEGAASHPRYGADFMRLRAELHVMLGEQAEAAPIYAELYESKGIAWARLGQARTLFMRARYEDARVMLAALVESNPRFVDAYDWLAKTLAAMGQLVEAQAVLSGAVAVSPHAVRRLRKLGEIALEAGDVDAAEKALKLVLSKARYSEFRDPEDHVWLVKTLVRKGNPVEAAAVIRDLDRSMAGRNNVNLCSAIASAMLHEYTGNDVRLSESLDAALTACRSSVGLSNDMQMELARNCLGNGKEEGALAVMRAVMCNATNNTVMARAIGLFEQAGRSDLALPLAQQSRQEVVDMVAAGAAKAKAGDFRGAVDLMAEAAARLPDNPQVAFNAAVAVLKCLENIGWDARLGQNALTLIASVRRLDPTNAKLPGLAGLHQQILKKYNIKAIR